MFPGATTRPRAGIAAIAATCVLAILALANVITTPLAAQSGAFGHQILIDDDEILIAEPTTSFRPGAVYIYNRSGGAWRESTILHAPDAERADGFGTLLARTGNTLFVGQRGGPIHIFERENGGAWRATGTIEGEEIAGESPECRFDGYCGTDFGLSLAAGGDWLMVGVPGVPVRRFMRPPDAEDVEEPTDPRGVVHAYQQDGNGNWIERARLQPGDGTDGDLFGAAILFTSHGVLIAAPRWSTGDTAGEQTGRVYRFTLGSDGWEEAGAPETDAGGNANFGSALATSGDRLLVGAPGANDSRGAMYMYTWNADLTQWVSGGEPLTFVGGESGDRFGAAVAFSGNDVWVGAPTTRGYELGSAFVYEARSDGSLPAQPRRIQLPMEETVESDRFGGLVVGDAGVVAVGAPGMHHEAGSVHLFQRDGDSWGDGEMLVSAPDMLAAVVGEEHRCPQEGRVGLFDCDEIELLAYIPPSLLRAGDRARGVRANDNWGWTDPETRREYALVGRNDGTSFVDITDPTNPVLVGDLPKPWGTPPSQLWRDIKTHKNHAFIVADGAGEHGMQVFDLTRMRDISPADMPVLFEPDVHYRRIGSSHNIAINEETGIAYTIGGGGAGDTCGGGLHMIDIDDPKNPEFIGCAAVQERGIHDTQCVVYRGPDERYQGREICLNSRGGTFQIEDVTDKDNPVNLGSGTSPNPAYIHQGWLTEDHRYFYQDDEADVIAGNAETTRTLIWDVSDLEDPVLVKEFMGSMPASAHNLYIKGDLVYQANYLYGLHILDISDPENPREVGAFDTAPYAEGPGFGGAWSNYPYFDSGTIIVTSMQEGLFVLKKRVRPVS
ncbi:MAG: choice-of-anchor B family protein [Gemmatimonadota bacterium]|nr:choice-of-anchor B family protein [Gemmatimonadota bacterium]MDE2984566.1 choice-of-anchor B family protein [Gemmatimonadota bacterium]